MIKKIILLILGLSIALVPAYSTPSVDLSTYRVVWDAPSQNSSESMPCGGGDIGLNVWVENGDILFYLSRSGTFDENNEMLKLGRIRLTLTPGITGKDDFQQVLQLDKGYVSVRGNGTEVIIWVDVFRPVVHVEVTGKQATLLKAGYENWRFEDFIPVDNQLFSNSFKTKKKEFGTIKTYKDIIETSSGGIVFYHRNKADMEDIFDLTVRLQGLESVKNEMYNPIRNLTFGGYFQGENMSFTGISDGRYLNTDYKSWNLESKKTSKTHRLEIGLHVEHTASAEEWKTQLEQIRKEASAARKNARQKTLEWWKQFWDRSYIFIEGDETDEKWQVARNYQLFRYQLACNAYGKWPTKFNGGLFTFDPAHIDSNNKGTPDHRNWGGGTMTAQNQRLVYWPMLKSGDVDMMKPQFDFYLRSLKNAELRSRVYWNHAGACFTEQIENFGLPQIFEYGINRPEGYDKGMQYNPWLEYLWETVFEFCMMIIETERFDNRNIAEYMPLIESCLVFYDEHYQHLARTRGTKIWDDNGCYVFYPSSACETYKMTYNSTTVICALKVILTRLLELPESYLSAEKREKWTTMLKRIPPVPFREIDGHKVLSPAEKWQFVQNIECPQLYPVFPWGLYGVGKPDLEIAQNTYLYDPHVVAQKNILSWKQYPIWAAQLGMADEAADLIKQKLKNSGRRFPTWWGPGHDWVPDHNWGGSGMIGLQEMLMQTDGEKIYLLPALPKDWDVSFKLHAPYQTTVEATVKAGKIVSLKVTPEERKKDVIIL
ncbi:MAG: DUF5703 domain-containing protein [Prevotellaceae bacterium]|jgi:phage pi2 protein 07|nr:DUF5703 domain-containing protein [Prevotellaceae bacterium]